MTTDRKSARGKPRVFGHTRGVEAVRTTLSACGERGIEYLTLFAFSSENWRRPADEVSTLMKLFMTALRREVDKLVEIDPARPSRLYTGIHDGDRVTVMVSDDDGATWRAP